MFPWQKSCSNQPWQTWFPFSPRVEKHPFKPKIWDINFFHQSTFLLQLLLPSAIVESFTSIFIALRVSWTQPKRILHYMFVVAKFTSLKQVSNSKKKFTELYFCLNTRHIFVLWNMTLARVKVKQPILIYLEKWQHKY